MARPNLWPAAILPARWPSRAAGFGFTCPLVDIYARNWIGKIAPIPERAREILLSDDEHQLLEPIDGGVAGVFADLLRESASEARELGRLHFALTDTLVVSGRRARARRHPAHARRARQRQEISRRHRAAGGNRQPFRRLRGAGGAGIIRHARRHRGKPDRRSLG
ncbi:MAG: hypothetical protein WDN48_00100 [Pseudolabrys sp.]